MSHMRPQEPPHRQPAMPEPLPFDWLPYLLSFLRRRWPAMALSVVACAGLALAYALTATPRFTAEVQLLIDIARTDQLRQQISPRDALTLNSVLESQVQLLQSAGLARKAVERLGLDTSHPFVTPAAEPLDLVRDFVRHLTAKSTATAGTTDKVSIAAEHLLTMLKVRRVGQTYVIGISITSPSAEEAAWLANGVAETYLNDEVQAKEDGIRQATGWLQVRIKELNDQALAADRSVQEYKAAHNIIDTDRGLMGNQQLTELTSQLVNTRATAATMQARLQRINAIMANGVGGGNVVDGLDNRVIVTLRQQYVDDDRRMAELISKFGKDHQTVRDLRREMTEVQKSIYGELARIAETYKSDYEVARANEESVQARLDQMITAAAQTNVDMVVLRSLQSSADTFRSLYQNFLQRYTQAVQDESFPVPEARVVTRAVPPDRKSEPKTMIILAFAGVLGGGVGFSIAFLRETLDRRIRTPAQLRAATGLECLALVPRPRLGWLRRLWRRRERHADATAVRLAPGHILRHAADAPRSDFADAIRTLRLRLTHQRLSSRDARVIGCMSSTRHAGASTIAANLAEVLVQTGGSTILLDWDFCNASLSRKLTGRRGPGCLNILACDTDIFSAVHRHPATGLDFLPAGVADATALPRLVAQSGQIHELIANLRSTYSYVVIDLPSLSAVADAHFAAHMLDAIVVVAEWGRAEQMPLPENLARIGLDATNVLGVVLNKASLKRKWVDVAPARGYAPSLIEVN
jgi:succinoglycan biosynthesis transport protein ExoP